MVTKKLEEAITAPRGRHKDHQHLSRLVFEGPP